MPTFRLERGPSFEKDLHTILGLYPNSQKSIETAFESLCSNPTQGERYPSLGFAGVYKLRLPLKEYNVGKSKGLRIIYFVMDTTCIILLVYAYRKTAYRGENVIIAEVKKRLKQTLNSKI